MLAPIFPAEKTDELLGILIPDDARKEGGVRLQECLRRVFDLAARIGHQQWAKETACAREEGFEAGRKEGLKEQQLRTYSEASVSSSHADSVSVATRTETQSGIPIPYPSPSRSLSTATTQTEPVGLPPYSPKSDTTSAHSTPFPSHPIPELPLELPPAARDEDLDAEVWHDAPEPPAPSPPSPSPTTFTRDFSDLRTGTSRPFASLQRRRRRAPRAPGPCSSSPRTSHAPQTIVLNIYDSGPKIPRARYAVPSLSIPTPHSHPPAPTCNRNSRLDWGHDPRLRDLSRALTALGWVRPR